MKWDDFVKRRRLDEKSWVISKGLKTKESFLIWCSKNGVETPEDNVLSSLYPAPIIEKKEKKAKVVEPKSEIIVEKDKILSEDNSELVSQKDVEIVAEPDTIKKQRKKKSDEKTED